MKLINNIVKKRKEKARHEFHAIFERRNLCWISTKSKKKKKKK